jgi:hypothetical protein
LEDFVHVHVQIKEMGCIIAKEKKRLASADCIAAGISAHAPDMAAQRLRWACGLQLQLQPTRVVMKCCNGWIVYTG